MNRMMQTREKWVDDVKLFGCILVVLGHFFRSLIRASVLQESVFYEWFEETIYCFHVPLFFLCSGYLYQRKGTGDSRRKHLLRKALALGVPYVTFSALTWLLKALFSEAVNTPNASLMQTLLLDPISPYWYLYTLFFIFLVVPCVPNERAGVVAILGALALKAIRIYNISGTGIYAVDSVMNYVIWFVLGMAIRFVPAEVSWSRGCKLASAVVFLVTSLYLCRENMQTSWIGIVMGFWGCVTVVLVMRNWKMGERLRRVMDMMEQYIMPIFLMHTIFAAGIRSILLRSNIENPVIHIVFGITGSFVGPIIAAAVMERLKLDVFIYPNKYLFKGKSKE